MTRIINILAAQNVKNSFIRQPIEFYLAHIILKHKDVYKKARQGSYYKIVDCSACELGTGVDMTQVLKAADIVGASEIVLPDIVKSDESLDVSLKALDQLNDHDLQRYNIAIVIQGSNLIRAANSINKLRKDDRLKKIHTIMIPKWFTTKERAALTMMVQEFMPDKDIHWLGLGDDIEDCITTAKELEIRSLDTGYFISVAQKDIMYIFDRQRDKEHTIDLEINNLKDYQIYEVIDITNNLNYAQFELDECENCSKAILWTIGILMTIILIVALCLFYIK